MADVRPFRGIRYDFDTLGKDAAAKVVSPPYDVIDEAGQDELYTAHPKNFVRVDLNRGTTDASSEHSRYARARRYLMDWLADGTMTVEDAPALYLHHQTFTDARTGKKVTRKGFLGRIRLAEYEEGIVLPHERTLKGPKIDRLELMKATETNLSPVFFLYDDEKSTVDKALAKAKAGEALRVETSDGIVHELWAVHDPEAQRVVGEFMADQSVLIADGHHRYETALAYREFRRETAEEAQEDAPYEFALGFFVNAKDPGLVVYPTHRVVYGLDDFDFTGFIEGMGESEEWQVSRIAGAKSPELLQKALTDGGKTDPSFLLMAPGEIPALVKFKGKLSSPIFDEDTPREVRQLDVAILHEGILDRMLGISKQAQEAKTNLNYVKGFEAADDASNQLVVLMNPTPVEQVDEVCRSGGKMPQKSTFFYPKILSGLLLNPV